MSSRLPSFGHLTSLVLFLAPFAALELRGADAQPSGGQAIEISAPGTSTVLTNLGQLER